MSASMTTGDLAMVIAEKGSLSFLDYEPRDCPGYTSTIWQEVGAPKSQVNNLLRAADALEDDHHYDITRRTLREKSEDTEIRPAQVRVTIRLA